MRYTICHYHFRHGWRCWVTVSGEFTHTAVTSCHRAFSWCTPYSKEHLLRLLGKWTRVTNQSKQYKCCLQHLKSPLRSVPLPMVIEKSRRDDKARRAPHHHPMHFLCISYSAVAMIKKKYHGQKQFKKRKWLVGVIILGRLSPSWLKKHGMAAEARSWLVISYAGRGREKKKTGDGARLWTLKAHSRDGLLPTRLHLLSIPSPTQERHQLGTMYSNIWACEGHFSCTPWHTELLGIQHSWPNTYFF